MIFFAIFLVFLHVLLAAASLTLPEGRWFWFIWNLVFVLSWLFLFDWSIS